MDKLTSTARLALSSNKHKRTKTNNNNKKKKKKKKTTKKQQQKNRGPWAAKVHLSMATNQIQQFGQNSYVW